MVRMRFPYEALEELKKIDPETPVTLNFIRTLARSGKIPFVPIGNRRLLNFDALLDYLQSPPAAVEEQEEYGQIRKIR
ncbi:MAG: hypothetical protein KBC20_01245 [Oscillospiraceae bacterium]|jgi:excisionase family DNA binding protein|nr:hypothetical protein [Oscillospiraceae bacterium]